jgi:hypothetical protein
MRALLGDKRELAQKLASLEKELKKTTRCSRGRYCHNFATSNGHHRSAVDAFTAKTTHRI